MLVYRGFSRPVPKDTVLTIGNFDGVHQGHRALLARLKNTASLADLLPAVLTFEPHPREFFAPESAPARLSTLREKLELMTDEGVELACVGHFNTRFAALSAEDFIDRILIDTLRVKHLIIGDDFCFGAGRRGDFALLREAGQRADFQVDAVSSVTVAGERVSSSGVRVALTEGRLEHAALLLGRPYSIDGRVVHGKKMGRKLGFPTANIRIKHAKPPLTGVFAVEVGGLPGGPRQGVANLGIRPSVNELPHPLLEVHLFDFSDEIYGTHLNVRFLHKIRSEVRFPSLDALKAQIILDVESAKSYFKH